MFFMRSKKPFVFGLCFSPPCLIEFSNSRKQFLLLARQVDRRFDPGCGDKDRPGHGTHVADALVAQTEGLAALRAFGDRYARLSFERRHFDFAAERRRRERNRQIHMKVITVALENLARTDADSM